MRFLISVPREAVDVPSLEVFKAGLDGILGSPDLVGGTLLTAVCQSLMVFKVPSNISHSMMSVPVIEASLLLFASYPPACSFLFLPLFSSGWYLC